MSETLDRFLGEIPPQDILILSMGFFAGTQGYTPLSALMKFSGDAPIDVDKIKDTQLKAAAGQANVSLNLLSLSPFSAWAPVLLGEYPESLFMSIDEAKSGGLTDDEKAAIEARRQHLIATIALGCIGAIEAYAVTRPGTVQGVGEIVKGIGEMIPG